MTAYWFEDPLIQSLGAIGKSAAIRGLVTTFLVPKIYVGDECLNTVAGAPSAVWAAIANRCPQKRAFIVTDEGASRYARRVAEVIQFHGFTVQVWDQVKPEVPLESVQAGADEATKFAPDVIIGVGGGSALDSCKAIFSLYERPDLPDLGAISPMTPLNLRKKAILAAIPTTSGTGSECTIALVASDTVAHRKIPLANPEYLPDYAILIPAFTVGMPAKLAAGTGFDVLAHATDCVTSPMTNDFCDPLALRAIDLVFKWLPRSFADGSDKEARTKMHIAATVSGIAFGNGAASLTHSLGHSLGHLFNLHHGIAVGIFVPYTLQYYSVISDRYLNICDTLKITGRTDAIKLQKLVDKVKALMEEVKIPTNIAGLGISRDDMKKNMDMLIKYAMEDPDTFQSPRSMTREQCEKLFWYTYEGKDVDF
jgi:alcohol dehydrogenase class IV